MTTLWIALGTVGAAMALGPFTVHTVTTLVRRVRTMEVGR